MTNKFIGEDLVAELVHGLRDALGDPPDWSELEPMVYDTIKDYDGLPELPLSLDISGGERLTAKEKQAFSAGIAERFVEYGRACRKDLIVELVNARIKLFRLENPLE